MMAMQDRVCLGVTCVQCVLADLLRSACYLHVICFPYALPWPLFCSDTVSLVFIIASPWLKPAGRVRPDSEGGQERGSRGVKGEGAGGGAC